MGDPLGDAMTEMHRMALDLHGRVDERLRELVDYLRQETGCTEDEAVATLRRLYQQAGTSPYDLTIQRTDNSVVLTARVPDLPA